MSAGYGIAGHRNGYSSRILVGNWVEDAAGLGLAAQRRETRTDYTTQARASFPRPTAEQVVASQRPDPEAYLAREGVSHHVMFAHGFNASDADDVRWLLPATAAPPPHSSAARARRRATTRTKR